MAVLCETLQWWMYVLRKGVLFTNIQRMKSHVESKESFPPNNIYNNSGDGHGRSKLSLRMREWSNNFCRYSYVQFFGRFSLFISTVVGSFNDQNLCWFFWLPTRIDFLICMYEFKRIIQSGQSLYIFFYVSLSQ